VQVVIEGSKRLTELSRVVEAANALTWDDFQKLAIKLAKKVGVKTWESVEVRRYSKTGNKKQVKVGPRKFVVEPGDLFMFLEDDDGVNLWVEGMERPFELSQKMYDTMYDASKHLKKSPAKSAPPKSAKSKDSTKPTVLVEPGKGKSKVKVAPEKKPEVVKNDPSNIAVSKSMLPVVLYDKDNPLSKSDYTEDRQIGYLYTMHGGASVYLLGVGARVIKGQVQTDLYAAYVDKKGSILRSHEPVNMSKPALGLRALNLSERMEYNDYVSAYRKAADHIRTTLNYAEPA
jgi:hypothetical protein